MTAVKTIDGLRTIAIEREVVGRIGQVFVQITSTTMIPSYQLLTFSAEAWDELVAGAK